jgi:Natural resistance-associated macrophage protein
LHGGCQEAEMATAKKETTTRLHRLFAVLGPGFVTGAADDDPSGIATYSQAGAILGFSISWTMLLTYPLMAAIQEISARIGRTTGHGIAGNLRKHYPNWFRSAAVSRQHHQRRGRFERNGRCRKASDRETRDRVSARRRALVATLVASAQKWRPRQDLNLRPSD